MMKRLDQEARLSFNVPALVANRFVIHADAPGIRIAFAEGAPGEDKAFQFHSAVMTSVSDAVALRDALNVVLSKILPGA